MKNAQCKRCLNKFKEKDIYTIQQFQYRKSPSYDWTKKFVTLKIDEGIHCVRIVCFTINKFQMINIRKLTSKRSLEVFSESTSELCSHLY